MIDSELRPSNYYELPNAFVLHVEGEDAAQVVNNLCTQNVLSIKPGMTHEGFITNVRGWVVAHVLILRNADEVVLVGQHPSPTDVCQHIEKYIVREKANVLDRSAVNTVLVTQLADEALLSKLPAEVTILSTQIIRSGSVLVTPNEFVIDCVRELERAGYTRGTTDILEWLRIENFWPLAGREILEKTLPQELDRDTAAISFTKGCYLGQETIARLDARGQLQKKLCLLRVDGKVMTTADKDLSVDDKPAGELTSISQLGGESLALGYVKRGYFAEGTQLRCGSMHLQVIATPL